MVGGEEGLRAGWSLRMRRVAQRVYNVIDNGVTSTKCHSSKWVNDLLVTSLVIYVTVQNNNNNNGIYIAHNHAHEGECSQPLRQTLAKYDERKDKQMCRQVIKEEETQKRIREQRVTIRIS